MQLLHGSGHKMIATFLVYRLPSSRLLLTSLAMRGCCSCCRMVTLAAMGILVPGDTVRPLPVW